MKGLFKIVCFCLAAQLGAGVIVIDSYRSGTPTFELISAVTPGTPRGVLVGDFNGKVGFEYTTPVSGHTITHLGYQVITGNTGNVTVTLMDTSLSVLATATVDTTGITAGTKLYSALGSSVPLTGSTNYRLTVTTTVGGNQFYDDDTTYTLTTGTAVTSGGVDDLAPTSWFTHSSGNKAYGIPLAKYQ